MAKQILYREERVVSSLGGQSTTAQLGLYVFPSLLSFVTRGEKGLPFISKISKKVTAPFFKKLVLMVKVCPEETLLNPI